ncbi:MAG TPA: hypothetical protein VMZ28_16215, partial [Kofleriaceae bacterium]|nr:hypothetical protein [Kofleriaceae bacterium]
MAREPTYLEALAGLHLLPDRQERTMAWRQGLAALAALSPEREPAPLEGIPGSLLLASVRAAAGAGLLEDVGFLAPSLAGRALFELASALPASPEKRELGRAVLRRLREGDRATFVALAGALALSGGRFLDGPTRTRVVLALQGAQPDAGVDALALAILSRRDLEREWIALPSTGALPARRLTARLLERAARAAARRLAGGDDGGLAPFQREGVSVAWRRLLADREALVWRHAAVARGLLAAGLPALAAEIEADLRPALSPTEWRRAAASSSAWLAVDPGGAERLRAIVRGELVQRDAGLARSLVAALGSAYTAERERADEVAAEAVEVGGVEAVHGVIELRREIGHAPLRGGFAVASAQAWVETELSRGGTSEEGRAALDALMAELSAGADLPPLAAALDEALWRAVDGDLPGARAAARRAVAQAAELLDGLVGASDGVAAHRRHLMRVVPEIDRCLFEQDVAHGLLAGDEAGAGELADIYDRLARWLVDREVAAAAAPGGGAQEIRMVRLRALLHLVDSEPDRGGEGARDRRLTVVRALLRLAQAERSSVRRAVWATLARACDALLRDELVEFSDMLLAMAGEVADPRDMAVLEEASMLPDLSRVLAAYAAALGAAGRAD